MNTLPKDPVILLSYVNTQLRDNYRSLDEFCRSAGVPEQDILSALSGIGYRYEPDRNQFR